jgi:hypothetical protein
MPAPGDRFVPKVHPATRPVEPEDPYTLHATSVGGDPEVMLQCLVQEYAWMGWDGAQILALFQDPFYPSLNHLWQVYGAEYIRDRVNSLLRETGVFRFRGTVVDGPEDEPEEGPELVQLGLPAHWKTAASMPPGDGPQGPGGSSHAQRL